MDTIKAPKEAVRTIYEASGVGFAPEYEERLDAYLKSNAENRAKAKSSNKGVMHSYSLEDYGLTKEQVAKEFQSYVRDYCR